MDPFQIGDVIAGKYQITRVLGRGGMGVVVAARHRELGELVARKFLRPSSHENAESIARFAREARTANRIKNEHVARVFDTGTVDGVPFMVMEHLTGEDLAHALQRRGPLPAAEAVDLLLQACEAIADAHNLGIVHRDLKPANLFLTTSSDGMPSVKVLDFGISKSTSPGDLSVTATAAVMGSPLYMSPEQLVSSRTVDARADVWSLGVILYEMLAGTRPFAGQSFAMVSAAIVRGTYTPVSELRPDCPPAVEEAITGAVACDRGARLPTVAAFAARIAPCGSEAARASFERIAARPPLPSEPGEGDAGSSTVQQGPPPAGKLLTSHVCQGGLFSPGDAELVRMGDDVLVTNLTPKEPERVPVCAGRLHGSPRWRGVTLRGGRLEVHPGGVYFSRYGGADHASVKALNENLQPTGLPPPPDKAPVSNAPCGGLTGTIVRRSEAIAGAQVVSMEACCGDEGGGLFVCRPPGHGS